MEDFIGVVEGVVPDETCDALINLAETGDILERATVFDRDGQIVVGEVRQNSLVHLTADNCGAHLGTLNVAFRNAYLKYAEKFPILASVNKISLEAFTLLRYDEETDFYDWHVDGLDAGIRSRFLSQVAYLNDVEKGGETEFLLQGRKVQPRRGSIVVFPSGWTHQHRALPPITGKKYAVTNFLRFPGPHM